jgi:hypothetical protein
VLFRSLHMPLSRRVTVEPILQRHEILKTSKVWNYNNSRDLDMSTKKKERDSEEEFEEKSEENSEEESEEDEFEEEEEEGDNRSF